MAKNLEEASNKLPDNEQRAMEREPTHEESVRLANAIESIKIHFPLIDMAYAKLMVKKLRDQANWMDSAAALNPAYMPEKSDLMRMQAHSMELLIEFFESLLKCDEMKKKVLNGEEARARITQMFS